MKLGIIFCGFNEINYVRDSIAPWIEAKKRHDIYIASVSIPFLEYKATPFADYDDGTGQVLKELWMNGKIESHYDKPKFIKEHDARNLPFQYLKQVSNVDYIMLVDADEIYTAEQIDFIFKYVQERPKIDCFKIFLKNYIMDGTKWVDNFCPPRIFKMVSDTAGTSRGFFWDNDVVYLNGMTHQHLPMDVIPRDQLFVKHMSWTNDKGKRKVEYQMIHFGSCSYKWNEEKQSLEIDYSYFDKIGEPHPTIYNE